MEHIWDEVREKWFANEVFDSLDGVEDRLVEALVALEGNQDLVASTQGGAQVNKDGLRCVCHPDVNRQLGAIEKGA